mgnify:CR=1 FL=1
MTAIEPGPASFSRDEILPAPIPCSPVQSIEQMAEHPQTQALGLIQPVPGTGMRFVALPMSLDGQRPVSSGPPPTLGQHTDSILFSRS